MGYELGEHVHWFLTDKCNEDCAPCFREFFQGGNTENLMKIARILAENNVKKVTIGGGEPLLVENIDDILKIFWKAGIPVDLHTNCLRLSHERLERFKRLVDTLGLPIDSLDYKVQAKLREPGYLKQIKDIINDAQAYGYGLEYHTVATYLNIDGIPKLYSDFIKNTDFKCWNIYEFNFNLARQNTFQSDCSDKEKVKRLKILNELRGPLNHEKGLSDGLLAKFLLTEEKMKDLDDRIHFVDLQNSRAPYFFVNGLGDVKFYTWFSQKRRKIANLFEDGFAETVRKLRRAERKGPMFNQDDFIEAIYDIPIFARLYEGNCSTEEIEMIKPKYDEDVTHLARLWETKRYGKPMTA